MGVPKPERRLDRARRPRREESQDHRSPRRHLHAKADPSRKGERQALLVRPRRDARDARQSRWFEHRDPRRTRARAIRDRRRCDEVVRRHHRRSRAAANLLDAERPGQCRPGPHLPRQYRNPERRDARPTAATSKCCSTACPSRSISSSISKIASSTGPIAAIRRAATRSIAHRSMRSPSRDPQIVLTHLMEGIGIALESQATGCS